MQYFEIVLECGHLGAGSGFEIKRYFKGRDVSSILSKVRYLPRIKKRHTVDAVKFLRQITKMEYIKGKLMEFKNPYLWRTRNGYRCPICGRLFKDAISLKQHIDDYQNLKEEVIV